MSTSLLLACLLANLGAGPVTAYSPGNSGALRGGAAPNPCVHPGIFGAVEVVRAYRDNQAYAAQFIEGREVQISGRIVNIRKLPDELLPETDKPEVAYAILLTPDGKPAKAISLTFVFENKEEDLCKLAQLFVGQYVRIKGTYYEKVEESLLMEVKFRHCRLAF